MVNVADEQQHYSIRDTQRPHEQIAAYEMDRRVQKDGQSDEWINEWMN